MPGYPATGTLSYNGFTFEDARKVKVASEFVMDEAARTVTHVKYTITVDAIIAAITVIPGGGTGQVPTDTTLEGIRVLLSKPGRTLTFINEGFGTKLIVNADGAIRDVKWGPKPKILSWESVGDAFACHVIWQVETCIPECTNAKYSGVSAINFEVLYDIDENGDTTRTISGYLEIAQTWNGTTRSLKDNADFYRSQIAPDVPRGFTRKQTWRVSKDKSRLEFTIIDREIPSPNPYPEHVTAIEGRAVSNFDFNKGIRRFDNALDMKITPRKGMPGSYAASLFYLEYQRRAKIAAAAGATPFLTQLSFEEDIFGRSVTCHASWWFLAYLGDMLNASGLWTPLNNDWTRWKKTLSADTFDQRGHAGLAQQAASDAIVDLCGSADLLTPDSQRDDKNQPKIKTPFKNEKPKKEKSWLYYENNINVIQHNKAVVQSTMQQAPSQSGADDFYPRGENADVVQVRGAPSYTYTMIGRASRAGYPVPKPSLISIGGVPAQASGYGEFESNQVANVFGVSVYHAWWSLSYVVPNPAGLLPIPDQIQDQGAPVASRTLS
jgi:hypothetical protein